jgi:uncharacterized protein (UPF0216 family)
MQSEIQIIKRIKGYDPVIIEERQIDIRMEMESLRRTLEESAIYRQIHAPSSTYNSAFR